MLYCRPLIAVFGEWCEANACGAAYQPESAMRAPGHGSPIVLSDINPLSMTLQEDRLVNVAPVLLTHRPRGCRVVQSPLFVSGDPLMIWAQILLHLCGTFQRSVYFLPHFSHTLTCTTPPFQLIQKLRNSSQERMPGVEALTRGSPILPMEIQERVFCLPPSTISSISALSWGLAERAKWASLWVFTATWNWIILAGFFTYWYSYLLGVEMWILSDNTNTK